MSQELIDAITRFNKLDALRITDELVHASAQPEEILDASRSAMQIIGKKFEAGEYFLPELIISGDILDEVSMRGNHPVIFGISFRLVRHRQAGLAVGNRHLAI